MRLYVNSNNQWFGNQDDANAAKSPYELCVVPDDKKGLITFLNNFKAFRFSARGGLVGHRKFV